MYVNFSTEQPNLFLLSNHNGTDTLLSQQSSQSFQYAWTFHNSLGISISNLPKCISNYILGTQISEWEKKNLQYLFMQSDDPINEQ